MMTILPQLPSDRQCAAWHALVVLLLVSVTPVQAQDLGLRLFRSFECNSEGTAALAVDHTERLAASAGGDNLVSLWDLQTSKQIRQWKPSPSTVIDVAFKPGSHWIASASYPKSLTLHDPKTDERIWQAQTLTAPTRVAFSRDGSKLAVGSAFGKAMIYEAETGKLLVAAGNEQPESNGVEFSIDGRFLYVAGNPKRGTTGVSQIIQLDSANGKTLASFGNHSQRIVRLRVSPDGRSLLALDRGGNVTAWDTVTRSPIGSWTLELNRANNGCFLDNQTVLIGAEGKIAIIRFGNPKATIFESDGAVHHLAALPSRGVVASAVGKDMRLFQFDRSKIKNAPFKIADSDKAPKTTKSELVAGANEPSDEIRFDGLVSRDELQSLLGKPLAIKLRTGRLIAKVTLDELQFDRKKHGLKFIKYREGQSRPSSVKVSDVYAFWVGTQRYHLRYFPPTGQLFVINLQVADALAENRLAAMGSTLRERLTEEQQSAATAEHKQFLQEAAETLAPVATFHLDESASTLIFTDYPPAMMGAIKSYVDDLNAQLNQMFGIPAMESVWRGKPILAVFSSPSRFGAFEEKVMNNPNHNGRTGVRSGERRFLQTSIAKKFGPNVARGLAWGYSLGFAQRLHSNRRSIPWINMGIANNAQFAIVPDEKRQASQRRQVQTQVSRAQSLLGLLAATQLEQERWPIAGQLVQFLLSSDSIAFSQMFRDVKRGVSIEDALMQNYAASPAILADQFGRSLGISNVQP